MGPTQPHSSRTAAAEAVRTQYVVSGKGTPRWTTCCALLVSRALSVVRSLLRQPLSTFGTQERRYNAAVSEILYVYLVENSTAARKRGGRLGATAHRLAGSLTVA